jgi:hypothetical protein
MGAPSPELCNLWLARAFNAQDVEAAAAMYHPEASIVRLAEVHGETGEWKRDGLRARSRSPAIRRSATQRRSPMSPPSRSPPSRSPPSPPWSPPSSPP